MLHYDSKFMYALSKLTDLMILNALTFVCALPIFTMGASLTALHYALRCSFIGEENGSAASNFFYAFRINFKKATIMWLPLMAVLLLTGFSLYVNWTAELNSPTFFIVFNYFCLFLAIAVSVWLFGLQARFENSVGAMIKNAFSLALTHPIRSFLMVLLQTAPIWVSLLNLYLTIYGLLFGYSVPALFSMLLYLGVFHKLELQQEKQETELQERPAEEDSAS